MASARMTGSMQKHPEPTKRKAGRPKVVSIPRQRPCYYIWPKIPEGTAALQDCMSFICGHANPAHSNLDSNQWIKIIYQIWSARNKGWAGVSFGACALASIGNPLEAVGQRKFSSGGL